MSELSKTKMFKVVQNGCFVRSGVCRSFFLLLSSHRHCRLLECRLFACCFLIVAFRWLVLGVVWFVGLLLVLPWKGLVCLSQVVVGCCVVVDAWFRVVVA